MVTELKILEDIVVVREMSGPEAETFKRTSRDCLVTEATKLHVKLTITPRLRFLLKRSACCNYSVEYKRKITSQQH